MSYSTDLWDGINIVREKSRNGLKGMKGISLYFKERAAIEETFGTALVKSSKSTNCDTFFAGTVGAAVLSVRSGSERIGARHIRLSRDINDQICAPLATLQDEISAARKRLTIESQRIEKEIANNLALVAKAKAKQHKAAKDAQIAHLAATTAAAQAASQTQPSSGGAFTHIGLPNLTTPQQNAQRMAAKAQLAMKEAKVADQQYIDVVKQVAQQNSRYNESMSQILDAFQHNDAKLLKSVKQILLQYIELHERAIQDWTRDIATMRHVVSAIDFDLDLSHFIGNYSSGKPRPASYGMPIFEPFIPTYELEAREQQLLQQANSNNNSNAALGINSSSVTKLHPQRRPESASSETTSSPGTELEESADHSYPHRSQSLPAQDSGKPTTSPTHQSGQVSMLKKVNSIFTSSTEEAIEFYGPASASTDGNNRSPYRPRGESSNSNSSNSDKYVEMNSTTLTMRTDAESSNNTSRISPTQRHKNTLPLTPTKRNVRQDLVNKFERLINIIFELNNNNNANDTTSSPYIDEYDENDNDYDDINALSNNNNNGGSSSSSNGDTSVLDQELRSVAELLDDPDGRLAFAMALNMQRTQRQMNSRAFTTLASLIRLGIDKSHLSEDCKVGRLLMNMSQTFYRKREDCNQYIQDLIKDHPIWSDIRFWEGAFFDAVSDERHKQGLVDYITESRTWKEIPEEQRIEALAREENIVFGQLGSFAFNMINLGMDLETTRNFVMKMCLINTLNEMYEKMLMDNLAKSWEDLEAERLKQEKENWKRQQKLEWQRNRERQQRHAKLTAEPAIAINPITTDRSISPTSRHSFNTVPSPSSSSAGMAIPTAAVAACTTTTTCSGGSAKNLSSSVPMTTTMTITPSDSSSNSSSNNNNEGGGGSSGDDAEEAGGNNPLDDDYFNRLRQKRHRQRLAQGRSSASPMQPALSILLSSPESSASSGDASATASFASPASTPASSGSSSSAAPAAAVYTITVTSVDESGTSSASSSSDGEGSSNSTYSTLSSDDLVIVSPSNSNNNNNNNSNSSKDGLAATTIASASNSSSINEPPKQQQQQQQKPRKPTSRASTPPGTREEDDHTEVIGDSPLSPSKQSDDGFVLL